MANIARFDPFDDLPAWGRDFFRNMTHPSFLRGLDNSPQIRIDVSEDERAYVVKAEIPGVKKEDIKVTIDGNQVTVTAEVKKESQDKEGSRTLRCERYYGLAARSLALAEEVDRDGSQARYENGILELTLPKRPGGASRTIPVA